MPRSDAALYPGAPPTAVIAGQLGVPLRPTSWSAWDALWAALGWFVLANAVVVVLLATGSDLYGPGFLLTVLVPWIALAGWPLWVTRSRGNGPVIDLGLAFGRAQLRAGLLGGLACFVTGMVAAAISIALFGEFNSAAAQEAAKLADSSGYGLLAVFAVLVVVGAPIAEELTFRGLLWTGLAKRGTAPWLLVVITAAAFAGMHFEPERLLVLFGIGVVLGVLRWRTGSVGACIVAHAVNNFPAALGLLALPSLPAVP